MTLDTAAVLDVLHEILKAQIRQADALEGILRIAKGSDDVAEVEPRPRFGQAIEENHERFVEATRARRGR